MEKNRYYTSSLYNKILDSSFHAETIIVSRIFGMSQAPYVDCKD